MNDEMYDTSRRYDARFVSDDEIDFYDDDDGQPSEYDEWQDYMGGDDWDHGQYDCDY